MFQYLQDEQLFGMLLAGAILVEIIAFARGRYREGKPKGPHYSRRNYEFWYDPNRDLSSKLLLFSLHVLVIFLIMLGIIYMIGKYNNLF